MKELNTKTNDQIILERIIKEKCDEAGGGISINEYFEIYSASEILKNHDLTYDEIIYGIVGNGGDGGIDSMYMFINGEFIKEDTEVNNKQKNNKIELFIIQSKTSTNFKEDAIIKFRETSQDLFNLSNNLKDYSKRYNQELIDKANIFREVYSQLASSFPKLEIFYYYVTQGNEIHPNVQGKTEKLHQDITAMFSGAQFSFSFVNASKLLEMTRSVPSTSRTLDVAESPIGTDAGSYLCLVSLSKYYEFISDSGALARSIFESNVRDYQGNVAVNNGIRETLENKESENFWYLNNGVTIITPKAVMAGKKLTIEDPQIVNGLQTSHEVYKHFSNKNNSDPDNRAILVRVICEENDEARDRIIRATNSQTSILPASLKSSDEIHRDIEDYLKPNDFFYDRKKNFYKNKGISVSKIISISYMAQAMMSTMLLKPDSARARPSTLINSKNDYEKIFNSKKPINIYLNAIEIMKQVEDFLKSEMYNKKLDRKTINNIKYYVAMMESIKMAGCLIETENKISKIIKINISEKSLRNSLDVVLWEFENLGATDQVAKGPTLLSNLLQQIKSPHPRHRDDFLKQLN